MGLTGLSGLSGLSGIFGAVSYSYSDKVLGLGPIAYWPLWEAAGGVAECLVNPAQNGGYVGVTLGEPGIGDGNTCPLFDGIIDVVDIYSVPFRNAFDGIEGSLMIWLKVFNIGTWGEDEWRIAVTLQADGNNFVKYVKPRSGVGVDRIDIIYKANGDEDRKQYTPITDTSWIHMMLTWSDTADVAAYYFNGVQSTRTPIGTWVGALAIAEVTIGDKNTVPADPWHGWLAHCAIWDRPLSPGEVAQLAARP